MKLLFIFLFAAVALLCWAPLLTLGSRLFLHAQDFSKLMDEMNLRALRETLTVGTFSLAGSLAIALPAAWWLARCNLPFRGHLRKAFVFGYIIPPYLHAIAWVMFGVFLGFNFYNRAGLIWVFATAYFPIMLTSLCATMDSMDPSLEEAARVFGAKPKRIFLSVTLPLLTPSIISSALIYLLAVISAFGVPAIIGNPGRVFVLTTKIVTATQMGGVRGIDHATVLSLWLLGLTTLLLGASYYWKRRSRSALVGGKASRHSLVDLGAARWPILGGLVGLVAISLFLPLGTLILCSFLKVPGSVEFTNLTLDNYRYLFTMPEAMRAITNSLWLSAATGVGCVCVGFLIAYFSERSSEPGRGLLSLAASVPYALPGTLVALAFIVSFGMGWGVSGIGILGSSSLLLLAYLAKDLALGVQTLAPALSRIDTSLDEAGRVFGATRWGVLYRILVPSLRPILGSVFLLTALPAFTELTMSVLLAGPGTETIGTLLFQLQDYANPQAACSLATLLILFLGIVVGILGRLSSAKEMRK